MVVKADTFNNLGTMRMSVLDRGLKIIEFGLVDHLTEVQRVCNSYLRSNNVISVS